MYILENLFTVPSGNLAASMDDGHRTQQKFVSKRRSRLNQQFHEKRKKKKKKERRLRKLGGIRFEHGSSILVMINIGSSHFPLLSYPP